MTLKRKAEVYFGLALAVLLCFVLTNLYARSLNDTLFESVNVLDRLNHIAHRMEIAALAGRADTVSIDEMTAPVPTLFRELEENLFHEEYFEALVELGIAFVRLKRTVDLTLPGQTNSGPLFDQLNVEVRKIETAVNVMLKRAHLQINNRLARTDLILNILYPTLLLLILGGFVGILRQVIYPVLSLGRQITEVRDGRKENIDPPTTGDELGQLAQFTANTIEELARKRSVLEEKQREMTAQNQKREALSRILGLQLNTGTMEELLHCILETILALKWLSFEEKGGIFLVKKDSPQTLELVASYNFTPDIKSSCRNVPFGHCLCGRAAASREFIHACRVDPRHDISYPAMNDHGHYCIPIIFRETLLGVIVLYLVAGHEEQDEEKEFLTDVATLLAETLVRRESEERQRLISTAVDQAGEGIAITDQKGTIRYANSQAAAMSGQDLNVLLGSDFRSLFNSVGEQEFAAIQKAIRQGGGWQGEIPCRSRSSNHLLDLITVTPVFDDTGSITHHVTIKKDITDENALKAQLLQAQKMESIGRLAGGVAHDFNNILSVIIGFSELSLRSLSQGDPLRDNLEMIGEAGRKASALTRQLLAFSRKQVLEMRLLDLNSQVKNMAKMLRRIIGDDLRLEIKTSSEEIPVKADPGQIEQILMNLAVNARDAMPAGGCLTISTSKTVLEDGPAAPGPYALLQVDDTGEGIAPEMREKIFEPFFTTKDVDKGTGLGLATVYGILKQHNGHIEVQSEVGKGTGFRIYLPLFYTLDPAGEDWRAEDPSLAGTETVLVVDDDVFIRKMISESLTVLGYTVLEAGNGREALELTTSHTVDLLLTDVVMPDMNGRELADKITANIPSAQVLFMSGYTGEEFSRQDVSVEDVFFIQKPVTPFNLAIKVRLVLDGKTVLA